MTRDFRNPFAPEPETGWECALHGHVEGEVCRACFAAQQVRVERESHDLRYANTGETIRRRVLAYGNGSLTPGTNLWHGDQSGPWQRRGTFDGR